MRFILTFIITLICIFTLHSQTPRDTLIAEVRIIYSDNIYSVQYSKDTTYEDRIILDMLTEFFIIRERIQQINEINNENRKYKSKM